MESKETADIQRIKEVLREDRTIKKRNRIEPLIFCLLWMHMKRLSNQKTSLLRTHGRVG